jgi:hypothetical protein
MVQFVSQLIFWSVGLPLTVLLIAAMLRGAYKQYPVLFIYTVAGLLLTVAGMPAYVAFYFYHDLSARKAMAEWYAVDEALMEPLAYAVVISLIYVAASHVRSRRQVMTATIGGAVLIALGAAVIHHNAQLPNGVWVTLWTRDLNFVSEIFDLGLWGLLLSTRARDRRLLLVTGGLGVQFTGEAIGESIRSIAAGSHSNPLSYVGSFFYTLADLASLYILWRCFQDRSKPTQKLAKVYERRPTGGADKLKR